MQTSNSTKDLIETLSTYAGVLDVSEIVEYVTDYDHSYPFLYSRYGLSYYAQNAFVHISKSGKVTAEVDAEINGAVNSDVWEGLEIRIPISCQISTLGVAKLIAANIEDLQTIYTKNLDDEDVSSIYDKLECNFASCDGDDIINIAEIDEWLQDYSIEALAKEIEELGIETVEANLKDEASYSNVFIIGSLQEYIESNIY